MPEVGGASSNRPATLSPNEQSRDMAVSWGRGTTLTNDGMWPALFIVISFMHGSVPTDSTPSLHCKLTMLALGIAGGRSVIPRAAVIMISLLASHTLLLISGAPTRRHRVATSFL